MTRVVVVVLLLPQPAAPAVMLLKEDEVTTTFRSGVANVPARANDPSARATASAESGMSMPKRTCLVALGERVAEHSTGG